MMKNYEEHPIKLIIILLLAIFFACFLKEQVQAASCETGQVVTQYKTTSDTWSSYTVGSHQQTTAFRRLYTNASMPNMKVDYTFKAVLEAVGKQTTGPTFYIDGRVGSSGTYTNLSPYCNMIYVTDFRGNDQLITATWWTVTVKCTLPSTDSLYTRFRLELRNDFLVGMYNVNECMELESNPSDTEQQLDNIQTEMYEYYSSLWDKSNVSEQIILNRIQEAEEGVQEAIEQQTDDILNGGTPNQDDTNSGDTTNTDNEEAAQSGLGTLVGNHGWSEGIISNRTPLDAWSYIWGKIEDLFSLSPYGNDLDPTGNNNLKIQALFITIMGIGLIKFLLNR